MTTATSIIPPPRPRHAGELGGYAIRTLPGTRVRKTRIYAAFEHVALGCWRWRCLHCHAADSCCTYEFALHAAIDHPCTARICAQEACDE